MANFRGFCGPTYQEASVNFDAQRCINLFPVMSGGASKTPTALIGDAGLESWLYVSAHPIRGVYLHNNVLYVVAGNSLYEISLNKQSIVRGFLNTDNGYVDISSNNNNEVAIVDGVNLYVYNTVSHAFSTVTTNILGSPTSIDFIDQYFVMSIYNVSGTYGNQAYQISDLNSGTSWSATQYNVAAAEPDELVSVRVSKRLIYLLGQTSTEIWYDAGSYPFPFQFSSFVLNYGTLSPKCAARVGEDGLAFLGINRLGSLKMLLVNGYQEEIISTPAIQQQWDSYTTISDAYILACGHGGRDFLYVTFPSAGATFVYDMNLKLWHERTSYNLGYWRPSCHTGTFDHSLHLYGDSQTGTLMHMNENVYTELGDPIIRIRRAPHITSADDLYQMIYHSFQLDFEGGVGLVGGKSPSVRLRWSDDGGHEWSNYYTVPMGKIGEYKTRAIWRRLGASRDRVFEVSVSDPVKVTILGANIEAEKCNA